MTRPLRTLLLIADVLTVLHLLAGGASGFPNPKEPPTPDPRNDGSTVPRKEWVVPASVMSNTELAALIRKRIGKPNFKTEWITCFDVQDTSLLEKPDWTYQPWGKQAREVDAQISCKLARVGVYEFTKPERRCGLLLWYTFRCESGEWPDVVRMQLGNLEDWRTPTMLHNSRVWMSSGFGPPDVNDRQVSIIFGMNTHGLEPGDTISVAIRAYRAADRK